MFTITVTPVTLGIFLYSIIALVIGSAAVAERTSFANPRYLRAILAGLLWPWVGVQIAYKKVIGRYLINDLQLAWDRVSNG